MDLNVHERSGDTASTQKGRAKKMAAQRAAKFREETPRKGGGFAIKDRNTALQQYAEVSACLQGRRYKHSYQNAAERLDKITLSA